MAEKSAGAPPDSVWQPVTSQQPFVPASVPSHPQEERSRWETMSLLVGSSVAVWSHGSIRLLEELCSFSSWSLFLFVFQSKGSALIFPLRGATFISSCFYDTNIPLKSLPQKKIFMRSKRKLKCQFYLCLKLRSSHPCTRVHSPHIWLWKQHYIGAVQTSPFVPHQTT